MKEKFGMLLSEARSVDVERGRSIILSSPTPFARLGLWPYSSLFSLPWLRSRPFGETSKRIEMGSEAKSRKRGSSLSPSASPSEDEEKRSRKHRKRDDKERKSRKDRSKEKEKKGEKSHKHSRSREGKEKKSREKHKHSRKDMDSFEELSKDDYYSKNNEFSTWLKEERGIYFSDLSSEAARDLFISFVKDWNNRKLHSRYYEGISSGPRTAHNWKIKHAK